MKIDFDLGLEKKVKGCFENAAMDEKKRKKHKGLILVKPSVENAKNYLDKAKDGLKFCDIYKRAGSDYKILEEWFYCLYYCALAILSKFGIESRSQRCSALFLQYAKLKRLIDYDDEFIEKIMVYKEKDKKTSVDEREEARYSPNFKFVEVSEQYNKMMDLCKEAISQCEEIIFEEKQLKIPNELFKIKKLINRRSL